MTPEAELNETAMNLRKRVSEEEYAELLQKASIDRL